MKKKCTRKCLISLRFSLVILAAVFACATSFAQQKTIKGNIKDPSGTGVIGASVSVKGQSGVGTVSDVNGNFTLSVGPDAKTLVVKFMGMNTQEVEINGETINVVLTETAADLGEVVVIGYGSVRKKDLTGSVSSVGVRDLRDVPAAVAAQAITGRLAGVQVTTTDGSPDAEILIRIRGGGSVTGDNSPLYIIDGFPAKSINDIAPADIETFTVLKDASSTAIYGSQGANGVIIITTKSAQGGKTQISYNGFVQTKKLSKRMDVLSPYDYVMFNYERAALGGTDDLNNFTKQFGYYSDFDLYKYQAGNDWQDDLFGSNVISKQHNISINGGNEKTKYGLSGTYNEDGGLMQNNDFGRYTLNFKLNHEIARNLRFDFLTRMSDTEVNGGGTAGGLYKVRTTQAVTGRAVNGLSEFIADPSSMTEEEYEEYLDSRMTLTDRALQYWRRKNNNAYNYNASVSWDITKGLTYKIDGAYEYGFNQTKNFWGPNTSQAGNEGQNLPLIDWTKQETGSLLMTNTLSYRFAIKENHRFDVLVGQEMRSYSKKENYLKAKFFPIQMTPEKAFANLASSTGTNNLTITSYESPDENMASFFGRFNYGYADKYLVTFTMRADGSSKFAEGNRWGYFPAAAVAWRVSEESFMKNTSRWLTDLKFRLSYGEVGNNRIGSGLFDMDYKLGSASGTNRPIGPGEVSSSFYVPTNSLLPNPNLKWETTITRNAGVDFAFFNGRINGTIDVYKNTTKDLLIESDVVAPGYTKQQRNIGQTSNKGIELTLDTYIIEHKNYSLAASFNISVNRGKVDKLEEGINTMSFNSGWAGTDLRGSDDYRVIVGEPLGIIYGFVTDGYYTTDDFERYDEASKKWIAKESTVINPYVTMRPGALKLKDLDGVKDAEGKYNITENDRQIIGRTAPKHTGGFGLRGTFYGFDASVYFNWVYGNQIYNADKIAMTQQYRTTYPNVLEYMNASNRYTYLDNNGQVITDMATLKALNEGENAKQYWSPHNFGNAVTIPHSWAIEDGSYLRLQNVTLGYTLPQKFSQKFACNQFRVYCTLNNAWIWTKYTGFDPEVSTAVRESSTRGVTPGVDYSSYPRSFSVVMGVNITF